MWLLLSRSCSRSPWTVSKRRRSDGLLTWARKALLQAKAEQAGRNRDRLPAIAAAVRFDRPEVMISEVRNG